MHHRDLQGGGREGERGEGGGDNVPFNFCSFSLFFVSLSIITKKKYV